MKRVLFCIVALVLIGVIVVVIMGNGEKSRPETENVEEKEDNDEQFTITTLSDKDIYFRPEADLPNLPVINDMVDMANAYAIMRAVYCDAELWFRFGMVVNDEITKVKTNVIVNNFVRTETELFVKRIAEILPKDTVLWDPDDDELADLVVTAYREFGEKLSNRYNPSHYGVLTEKKADRYYDYKHFIPNYDSVYDLRKKQSKENELFLKRKAEQAPDFDTQCLYTDEYAHQHRHVEPHPAIPMLEALMKKGEYSRFLGEVWQTWRVLKQLQVSRSTDGVIRNLEYNKMRRLCLNTFIKQIAKNPRDIYAINNFAFLASYDNITRFSRFLFGNSVGLEHMILFPEIVEESAEDSLLTSSSIQREQKIG